MQQSVRGDQPGTPLVSGGRAALWRAVFFQQKAQGHG